MSKTRHSNRQKRVSHSMRKVDQETRKQVQQERIDELESDFYESPNRLAEDLEEEDFDLKQQVEESPSKLAKHKKAKKRVNKRQRRESHLRKNMNLQKLIKEEGMEEKKQVFPNFVKIKARENIYPSRGFCSICGIFSKYTCPRCGEKYCSLRCHDTHKQISCLNYDL